MFYATIEINPIWRCPCGAPLKAFDFRIEANEIVHVCRRCHTQLIEIVLASAESEETTEQLMSQKTTTCPCCGQLVIPAGLVLPRVKARIFNLIRRRPGISADALSALVWAEDPNGGSDRKTVHVHIWHLNHQWLAKHGLQIRGSCSAGYRVQERPERP
jgi:DNA-binding response OmpR family regulator